MSLIWCAIMARSRASTPRRRRMSRSATARAMRAACVRSTGSAGWSTNWCWCGAGAGGHGTRNSAAGACRCGARRRPEKELPWCQLCLGPRSILGDAGDAPPETPVGEDFARGVVAGGSRHAAAGMGARAAHVQPLQRPAICAVAQDRARRPELIEAHIAVHDVAADEAELALQIERRVDLPRDHRRLEARRPALDGIDDEVRRLLAGIVPAARNSVLGGQLGRELLAEQAGDMAS